MLTKILSFLFVLLLLAASCVKSEYFKECYMVEDDTYIPLPDDCHSYIYCSDNAKESFKDECPEGTYFEATTLECVIDEHNMCPGKDSEIIDTEVDIEETEKVDFATPTEEIPTVTATIASFSSTAETYVDFTTPRPICDRNVDTFYPHHKRCEYYYKCVAGYLNILRCTFFYAWDYHKEMCVPKTTAACYGNAKLRGFM